MTVVVKGVPVYNKFPLVGASHHFNEAPELAAALNVTGPASHLESAVVEVILGVGVTVAVTAILAEVHPLSVAST